MSDFRKTTLPNGLRVVTVEMPHLHSVEMVCSVGVGSRDESPSRAGISHFLEHMLFRGTAEHPSSLHLEQAFEAIGGAVNAATDTETTSYHSRIHPERVDEGVALFASMLQRPLLEDLEIERRIVLEEALDDLNERGEEVNPDNLTARLLWPDSSLAHPTIGTRKTIEGIGLRELRRHHETFYGPANAVLVAAGRVRHQDVADAAGRHFGAWKGPGAAPPRRRWDAEQGFGETEVAWVKDSDSQVALQLAFPLPGRHSELTVPLRVLRRVLSWGGTSRLMLHLRERLGLTYHVEANLSLFENCGCLSIDLAVAPENLVSAFGETLSVLADLSAEPIDPAELDRVIRGTLYDLDFSRDHADDLAVRYGWGELVGYLRTLEDDRRDLAAVDPPTLLHSARAAFADNPIKIAVVGPYRKRDQGPIEKLARQFSNG